MRRDECAAVVAREQVGEQSRADVADMQRAGRTRRVAGTNGHCGYSHSMVAGGLEVMS